MASRRLIRPVLFICDIQEKFRNAIFQYDKVISTTQKMLKASQILNIPIIATTQLKGKLGDLAPELCIDTDVDGGVKSRINADKSAFSMMVRS